MSIVLSRNALLPYIHIYLWPCQFVFGLCLYFSNMKSIVVVIQQPSAELRHFEQRSFSKAVQCHQSLAMYLVQQHVLFSLKLFALLVCFWQSRLSNINCSLQEVMVNCKFQSCEMISSVLLLYVQFSTFKLHSALLKCYWVFYFYNQERAEFWDDF